MCNVGDLCLIPGSGRAPGEGIGYPLQCLGFPGGSVVRNPPARAGDAGDTGWIPVSGKSPGGGNGNPLQDSCLGNPMDREASVQFSRSVVSDSLRPHELQHTRSPGGPQFMGSQRGQHNLVAK